jgi:hypothetical protein
MDKAAPVRTRREREGALAWLAFLAIAVIAVAALISGVIRHAFDPQPPVGASRGAADRPSPAPPPLPKPAVVPNGRALQLLA